jgi:putative MATE family efflux protein
MRPNDLTQGSVTGSLFRMTAPMMLGVSSTILVSMLEIGFIGRLGTEPVAALTFTFPLVMILNSVALGIGIGTSSVIARGIGSGQREEARRLGAHSLLLVTIAMIILSAIGWLTIEPVFRALGASAEVLPLIDSYLSIYYPSVVLMTLTMVAGNVMRANGNATAPGLVMTLGAVLHLVLDPFLIFGWFGFPRLEIAGAAWAMAISRVVTAAVLMFYVTRGSMVTLRGVGHSFFVSCRRILHVGLPAMATQLIGPVSAAVIVRLLADHGEGGGRGVWSGRAGRGGRRDAAVRAVGECGALHRSELGGQPAGPSQGGVERYLPIFAHLGAHCGRAAAAVWRHDRVMGRSDARSC